MPYIAIIVSKEIRTILYEIPSQKVPNFIGRESTLKEISQIFTSRSQSFGHNIVVLLGMGGQGKTQIALEYCQRMRQKYEYILWADADDSNTMSQSFKQFARRLARHRRHTKGAETGTDVLDDQSSLEFVKEALEDSHFLLVLDNLDNPGALQNVKTFFPISDYGHIIITRFVARIFYHTMLLKTC